jgi:uncharacterized YccA/Bax inhibitor family protein
MLGDVGIIVFALIGIFSKKRWAAVVASIWLITSVIIGLTKNTSNLYVEETFEGSFSLLAILEIVLVSIAWVVVVRGKYKNEN